MNTPPLLNFKHPIRLDPALRQSIDDYTYQLNRLFSSLGITVGSTSSNVLDRGNHVGRWYTTFKFVNPLSGFVLLGRPNSNRYRIYVDDAQIEDGEILPVYGLESAGSSVAGDIEFPAFSYGPILLGRNSNRLFRFFVRDDESDAPILAIEELADVNSVNVNYDYFFGHNGFSFINVGRTRSKKWLWYIKDVEEGTFMLEENT
jgi:hypothetical protein